MPDTSGIRVRLVQIAPVTTDRPALIPELLASVGAKYSRSGDGLDAILEQVDPENSDASIDRIFRHLDYGHASIGDMVQGIYMFIDGISMLSAYKFFRDCPLAGGQETSSRYCRFELAGLREEVGLFEQDMWPFRMSASLSDYEEAFQMWEELAKRYPELIRIPKTLLEDTSDKAKKAVARMRRNYAFDRARYFLPVAIKTNCMGVQSAREWARLIRQWLSSEDPELIEIAGLLYNELALVAPRMMKHASYSQADADTQDLMKHLVWEEEKVTPSLWEKPAPCDARVDLNFPFPHVACNVHTQNQIVSELSHRKTRYDMTGALVTRIGSRMMLSAIAIAELRDLNRHRTGTRYSNLIPVGFYAAEDQIPEGDDGYLVDMRVRLRNMAKHAVVTTGKALDALKDGSRLWERYLLLGSQVQFEHLTSFDKFIYEAELRTGTGAHYRYAEHLRDALKDVYRQMPPLKGVILEGSAEPE